jgi:hypothetical protein
MLRERRCQPGYLIARLDQVPDDKPVGIGHHNGLAQPASLVLGALMHRLGLGQ